MKHLESSSLEALAAALRHLDAGFAALPEFAPCAPGLDRMESVLRETAERLRDNYPYFHPLYAGQMIKPPHPVARAAYALAMWINPNNHALDGGRASSAMEKEAVAGIAALFGWKEFLGHLTGGGTMANLEALWVAGQLKAGQTILASSAAHYTHDRISGVLKLPFESIPTDNRGRMDCAALERRAAQGGVGCVVATLGTTGTGAVDPLPEILRLRDRFGFRVHADAAYGGYFTLAENLGPEARAAFDTAGEADSIVIDPHKHGLQPYGCGCVLFRDPAVGALYSHDSPYTYFSSDELHLGEISLECSRAGASAVALWATERLLPLVRGGEFAAGLTTARAAALDFADRLREDPRWMLPLAPELDIVVWAPRAETAAEASTRSRRIFEKAAAEQLHLALINLPVTLFPPITYSDNLKHVLCLRSVLMKPEHAAWIPEILNRLRSACV
ncbi:MAG TPA: aminotransferase class I/II-fold pyridoxal phosphate-dependent enzyme [Bryobacteraceae bacterium]|nr:aminotransferase class I/II-fold pyridoxal phosphate-dependent enzyme [Bryobacteraceae bacterium]